MLNFLFLYLSVLWSVVFLSLRRWSTMKRLLLIAFSVSDLLKGPCVCVVLCLSVA